MRRPGGRARCPPSFCGRLAMPGNTSRLAGAAETKGSIMVRARVPTMRWLVIVAALVVGPAANSEPIHLACEGAMRANEPRQERLDEKYLMSLVIDLSARTVKPEGHPSVPLKGSVDDEDVVAFASPRASDDVLDGRLNRLTGEALIHFLTDPMYEFHGRCRRAEPLFEKPHAR
jgi:hypothetical protein